MAGIEWAPAVGAGGLMGAGLVLALVRIGSDFASPGTLPLVAFLVPAGLALALVTAAWGEGPGLGPRLAWAGFAAALLTLQLYPDWLGPSHWGVDTWPGLPRGGQLAILVGVVGLALVGPAILDRLGPRGAERAPSHARTALAAVAATAAMAWTLRSNIDLGDAWFVMDITSSARERLPLFPRWPLASLAFGLGYRALHPWLSARDTVALVSCLAGAAAIVVALALLRRLYPPGRDRWVAGAFLFTTYGIVQPFFGYVEVYPLAVLALLVFAGAAVGAARGGSLWWVGLAGGLAFATYIPLVIPVGAAMGVLGCERWRTRSLTPGRVTAAAGVAALPPGLIYAWLWARDVPGGWRGFVQAMLGSLNLGWGGSWLIFVPPARLFGHAHLLDFVNEWLLVDAVGLALVAWGLVGAGARLLREEPVARLLGGMLLPTLLYTFLMNPLRPAPEDWDLFAHASVLTALLGPYVLLRRLPAAPAWYGALAVTLSGLSLAHTAPRVAAFHLAPPPEIRYAAIFGVGERLSRDGISYVLTDRETELYLRTLLRGLRPTPFTDDAVTGLPRDFDLTGRGAFVLRPEPEAVLRPNFAALGASYRQARVGDYSVYSGFAPAGAPLGPRPRGRWRASASHNPAEAPLMLDGDGGTRWSSGVPQRPGLWVELDLGEVTTVGRVRLVHGAGRLVEHPRGVRVSVAVEAGRWEAVLTVPRVVPRLLGRLREEEGRYRFAPDPAPDALGLTFPSVPARWIRLTALGEASAPWTIAELELVGPAP